MGFHNSKNMANFEAFRSSINLLFLKSATTSPFFIPLILFIIFLAFYDQNSLGVLERQEKELSIFYEDIDDDPSERITEESAPKVFSSELNSYSEETLTFAIIVTAFIALLLGIFMGVFVTKFCSNPSSHKNVQKQSPNSNENINRYSVTTLSRLVLTPRAQSFTLLMANLSQDMKRFFFSFDRCLNGTFP